MERLKSLRKSKNLTTTELSYIIGCSNPTITNYERGNREPDLATLIKLADFFNVSVDYLIGHDVNIEKDNPFQRLIDGQSPERQRIILDMLNVLCGMTDTQLKNTEGFFAAAFAYNQSKNNAYLKNIK